MSTLRTDNLTSSNGTGGSIPMSFAVQGTAKCWFNLNGTGTIAARDDFNISSYTDNGVGDYTATFSTARPNANYKADANCVANSVNLTLVSLYTTNAVNYVAPTTSAYRVSTFNSTGSAFSFADMLIALSAIHGDPH